MGKASLKTSLFFLVLTVSVSLLQYLILKPHLRYAFADVDWMFLLNFKILNLLHPNIIDHLSNAWNTWGVYTYQVYYIGLIEKFFGMDYQNFQTVALVFKTIATLSVYPLIYLVTKSKLAATLATLLYGVAYSSVGVMYTVVTSGLFVAIPVMNLFFAWYWHLITKSKNSPLDILIWLILFFTTLLLATERMYPLIPTVILIELFWWFRKGFSKDALFVGLKRLSPFLILFLAVFLYKISTFTMHSGNTSVTYQKLIYGNWHVLLSPIISFGSLFLPRENWVNIGTLNTNGLFNYVRSLLFGPMIIFFFSSFILSLLISKNPKRFILITTSATFIMSVFVYFLSVHHLTIADPIKKMSFDFAHVIPALIGIYVISLTLVLFTEWLEGKKKDSLLIAMVGGIAVSLVFIIVTWIPADYILVFSGIHRYLTIPAIGSSLFIAGVMTLAFKRIESSKSFKSFAALVPFLFVPIAFFNSTIISNHIKYELEFAGTDAAEHTRMKDKLWSYLGNINKNEPSVFYFDESIDYDNGYFNETTVMAGFNYWMRYRGLDMIHGAVTPVLLRSNLICNEPRSMCLDKVKELVVTKDGEKGILYGEVFHKKENFYAFRFINRDIIDIRKEVVEAIELR